MNNANPKVDAFINKSKKWQKEFEKLRAIILECDVTEELKWGKPCYTYDNNNVLIIQGFKDTCAVLFPKGALLKDSKNILEKPGENTQSAMRIPFTSVEQITKLESAIKSYIKEAIKVEKSGLKVEFKKASELDVPEEFQARLKQNLKLKKAFYELTPGRQRHYLMHFSGAKQSTTRISRIEKCTPLILAGKGLNDR